MTVKYDPILGTIRENDGISSSDTQLITDITYTKAEIDALNAAALIDGQQPTILNDLRAMGADIVALPVGAITPWGGSNQTLIDGRCYITQFRLRKPTTITGVEFWLATAGVYTADNYNGFGLYSQAIGTHTYTYITSTVNDGNLWKASSGTLTKKAFAAQQVNLAAGLYVVMMLWNTSDGSPTAPVMAPHGSSSGFMSIFNADWYMPASYITATQTALPNPTQSSTSGVTGTATVPGISLY